MMGKSEAGKGDDYRPVDAKRFGKNYMRSQGTCLKCNNYDESKNDTTTGEHCKLTVDDYCNWPEGAA